jgi:hypothetical protein
MLTPATVTTFAMMAVASLIPVSAGLRLTFFVPAPAQSLPLATAHATHGNVSTNTELGTYAQNALPGGSVRNQRKKA